MRKWSVCVMAGMMGMSVVSHADNGLTFSTVQPVGNDTVMEITGIERKSLDNAMELHNLIVEVRDLDYMRRQLMNAIRMKQIQEARLEALEECSIGKLSEQFKDPEAVWDKMKAEYARREQDMSIYVNSTEDATDEEIQAFQDYMETGAMTPDMVAELMAPWQIGQEILVDVYQNQDAWGERKAKEAPSFALWKDQKYQFDQEWDQTYQQINAHFGVSPQGRPAVGDEKYDYAQAEKVEKAHQDYLDALKMRNPSKSATLPESLRHAPVAPKPLPPKEEIVVYLETDVPENQFYPALPAPWQKYAENGFKDIDPQGEMAQDFAEGLTLRESVQNAGSAGNRLSSYASLKQSVDSTAGLEEMALRHADGQLNVLRYKIAKYIPLEENADLLDPAVQEAVLNQLKAKLKELIASAETEMSRRSPENEESYLLPEQKWEDIEDLAELKKQNPSLFENLKLTMPPSVYDQDKNLLAALKRDTDGAVFLNEINAGDVDKLLKEAEATKAFMASQDDLEKDLAMAASIPIDETCLNGGL